MAQQSKWRTFFKQLHNPPNWVISIVVGTALIICPLAVATIAMGFDVTHNILAILAYVLCGALLAYTLYLIIIWIRKTYLKLGTMAERFSFTRNLWKNYEFRSLFFGACTIFVNLGYTIFLTVMAIRLDSAWYGALALYHVLLVFTRGGVLMQNAKDEQQFKRDYHGLQKAKVGTFRYCGVMMMALTAAMIVSVVEMVFGGEAFRVPKWSIIFFGAFAAWRIVMAVVHVIRASKKDDFVVRAVRYINLSTAFVSALTFQTSLLGAFPPPFSVTVLNAISGGVVCIVIAALGIFMMSFGAHARRRLLAQEMAARKRWNTGTYNDGYKEEYGYKDRPLDKFEAIEVLAMPLDSTDENETGNPVNDNEKE